MNIIQYFCVIARYQLLCHTIYLLLTGCCLSQLCILLCTCFLLLFLLNFHFYFLFYFRKGLCTCNIALLCLLTINILHFNLSQTLLGFSQTCPNRHGFGVLSFKLIRYVLRYMQETVKEHFWSPWTKSYVSLAPWVQLMFSVLVTSFFI